MHFSFGKWRVLICPCGEKESTTSRNAKLCQKCLTKRTLGERFGSALRTEAAA